MSTATVPLQPSQLSSVGINGLETQVNFADLTNCTTKPSSVTVNSQFGFDTPSSYDFCHPSIRYFISWLSTIPPEWATCSQNQQIIYDPPSALTPVFALNGPGPPATITQAASPSPAHSASPGTHFPQAPPSTNLPSPKSKDATATGHVSKGPAGDPENTATDNAPSTSQLSAVVVVNRLSTSTKSSIDDYQANDPDENPIGGPSDPGNPSPPHPSLIAGDQKTKENVTATSSADADAGIGSARMSGLGAVGGGAAIHSAGQGSDGNVSLVAPSLGTASKTCGDDANLWVRIGLGLLVFVCVVTRTN